MRSASISLAFFAALFFSSLAFSQVTPENTGSTKSARYATAGKKAHHRKKSGRKKKRSGKSSRPSSKKMFSSSIFDDKTRKYSKNDPVAATARGQSYEVNKGSSPI